MRYITASILGLLFILACYCDAHCQWSHEMDSLARNTESEYHLPHGICRSFALQESGYDPTAARVEVGYFNQGSHYFKAVEKSALAFSLKYNCDFVTERAYQSISFSMFQIMGFNLRALGDTDIILSRITLADQFEYFGLFVSPLWKKYYSLAKVGSVYNSGSTHNANGSYARHIVAYQKKFAY